MEELIHDFSLDRVSKSGAKFDYEKGKWFNHQYLQLKTNEELAEMFLPVLKEKLASFNLQLDDFSQLSIRRQQIGRTLNSQLPKIIGLVKERVNFVPELWEQANFFFVAPTEYDEKSLKKRWKEDSPRHMQEMLTLLEAVSEEDWHRSYETQDDNGNTVVRWHLDDVIMPWIAEKEYGVGIVMNAFRICLVGAARGPHIWNITDVLGKAETIKRVHSAIEKLVD